MSISGYKSINGFTLIEVLISTVILAIGLLGLAGMQTLALKDHQDALLYAQAASLAYEMNDRIKANASAWNTNTLPVSALTTCPASKTCLATLATATSCTATEMAIYDYCDWRTAVLSRIGPTATANITISNTTTLNCSGGTSRRCITINWARSHQQTTTTTNNTFKLELTP